MSSIENVRLTDEERRAWFKALADYKRGWVNTAQITEIVESILAARLPATTDAEALADAWDEGWLASKRHERSEGQPKMSLWPNPYRARLAHKAGEDDQ